MWFFCGSEATRCQPQLTSVKPCSRRRPWYSKDRSSNSLNHNRYLLWLARQAHRIWNIRYKDTSSLSQNLAVRDSPLTCDFLPVHGWSTYHARVQIRIDTVETTGGKNRWKRRWRMLGMTLVFKQPISMAVSFVSGQPTKAFKSTRFRPGG
jgi:hypothetical protein